MRAKTNLQIGSFFIGIMIKKIRKIKNLGLVFSDYTWDQNLSEFKRFNLIYGWTGSGKTTLSNLFNALGSGLSEKYSSLEYEVETESGSYKQGEALNNKIRVFNQDYVENNVQILLCKAKSIYILGEENKKIADKIDKDEKLLIAKRDELKQIKESKDKTEGERNVKFTDVARTISSNTSGEATRRYDKRNAEEAFAKLSTKDLLDVSQVKKHNLTLRQFEEPILQELHTPTLIFKGKESDFGSALKKIAEHTKSLCSKTVESTILQRLKQNFDISEWVEKGVELHNHHKSVTCEFCNQPLPQSRISALAKYFNEADKELKSKIESMIEEVRKVNSLVNDIRSVDKANLYKEIQNAYQSEIENLEKEKKELLQKIDKVANLLEAKKAKTTEAISFELDVNVALLAGAIKKINEKIKEHNEKTKNFKIEKETSQNELEKHYLSTIYDKIKELDKEIGKDQTKIQELNLELIDLDKRISVNKSRISSSHKACGEINNSLKTFLGRDEIVFEVMDDGYVIKRNGEIAHSLSEGEKTAIALVYFTVNLKDKDFNVNEGIIIVDDPISSLDSNSLFQAFAFLKNAVKDAKQIFILTHNYDFLRLLLNWVKNDRSSTKSYYMIKNLFSNGSRKAYIADMDKELKEYESEYHYLFKILKEFESDGTIKQAYPIPNIARKVLDTFLMFRVPNGSKSQYEKLESLKSEFDNNKLTAIYKFTNDQSHITGKGFDPSLVAETQKNVKYLLEMIEAVSPKHYEIIVNSISN